MDAEVETIKNYAAQYAKGYGCKYPDSHIIRFNEHILKYEFNLRSGKIFDYGCGNGTNLKYFLDQGFIPFGCDTDEIAIKQCKELMPRYANNFFVCEPEPDLFKAGVLKENFDLIISNQTLYFISDKGIKNLVKQFYAMAKPNCIFFASMMGRESDYFEKAVSFQGEFAKVILNGRVKQEVNFNFKDISELEELFKPFKKLYLGNYHWLIRPKEKSWHNFFVGVKK